MIHKAKAALAEASTTVFHELKQLYFQAFFVVLVSFGEFIIGEGEDLDGEQSGVFNAINRHASHGNAGASGRWNTGRLFR